MTNNMLLANMDSVSIVVHLSDSFGVQRSVNLLEGLQASKRRLNKDTFFLTVFGGSSYADTLGCQCVALDAAAGLSLKKRAYLGPSDQYPVLDNAETYKKEQELPRSEQRASAVAIRQSAERLGVKGAFANVCLACKTTHIYSSWSELTGAVLPVGAGTGFGNRTSTQIPSLVKAARRDRTVHYVGQGDKVSEISRQTVD